MTTITTIADLEALYGTPSEAATVKEVDRITPEYRALIEASPFAVLATCGPETSDAGLAQMSAYTPMPDDRNQCRVSRRQ